MEEQIRDGLRCLQLSGAIFVSAHLTAPWCYESPAPAHLDKVLRPNGRRIILFHVFTEGQCVVQLASGGEPIEIIAGDILMFPFADQHVVGDPKLENPVELGRQIPPPPWDKLPVIGFGGGGVPTSLVCGYLLSDDAPFNPVLASLPRVIRVRTKNGPLARWIEASVQYALSASTGRDFEDPLLKRLPELLVMECLCEHARQTTPDSHGWLAGLTDPIVGRALGLMHRQPERAWTLDELAKGAASSRSTLDERFRGLLGRAPMSYLIAWRLQLAGRHLRSTTQTLGEIAE